ncbi:MAG: S1 RNA-binding domain-containing protein [Candidatus Woesearchaeota archaeon]|jgi:translation initiation factor 2 subunit 1
MLYSRTSTPEVEEIVLCKVTKLYPNSVFVDLQEYPGKVGVVYISEVAPGRIRNLRDYVDLDRQIVCKVIRVDSSTGNIDLSLRRVNSTQRMDKLEEIKQELKAETLFKGVCEKTKKPLQETYNQVSKKMFVEYSHMYLCFRDVASGNANLEKMGVEKDFAKELTSVIVDKFKAPKIYINGDITLKSYASEGVEKIKSTLIAIKNISSSISITYLGGGKYKFVIEDVEYKPAEKNLVKIEDILEKFKDKVSEFTLQREKSE